MGALLLAAVAGGLHEIAYSADDGGDDFVPLADFAGESGDVAVFRVAAVVDHFGEDSEVTAVVEQRDQACVGFEEVGHAAAVGAAGVLGLQLWLPVKAIGEFGWPGFWMTRSSQVDGRRVAT